VSEGNKPVSVLGRMCSSKPGDDAGDLPALIIVSFDLTTINKSLQDSFIGLKANRFASFLARRLIETLRFAVFSLFVADMLRVVDCGAK